MRPVAVGDIELVALADIAEVGGAGGDALEAFGLQLCAAAQLELLRSALKGFGGWLAEHDGSGVVAHGVRHEDAEGGERTGHLRDEHSGDAKGSGHGAGVQRAGAAEADEGEVAGVVAPLDGDDADGLFHGGLGEAEDAGGELLDGGQIAAGALHDGARALGVEADAAAEEEVGVEAAEDEVGVGDGGLLCPGRSRWVRDRRRRTRGRRAGCRRSVEAGEGAAASADGVDVEHGHADGHAGDDGFAGGAGPPCRGVDQSRRRWRCRPCRSR